MLVYFGCTTKIFQAASNVAISEDQGMFQRQSKPFGQCLLPQRPAALIHRGGREMNVPMSVSIAIVVEDESALIVQAVGIRKDVFIDGSMIGPEVIQHEVGALREELPILEQRRDVM